MFCWSKYVIRITIRWLVVIVVQFVFSCDRASIPDNAGLSVNNKFQRVQRVQTAFESNDIVVMHYYYESILVYSFDSIADFDALCIKQNETKW